MRCSLIDFLMNIPIGLSFGTGKHLRTKLFARRASTPDRTFVLAELASNVDWDDGIAVSDSHLCHPGSAVFGALLALMDEEEPMQGSRLRNAAFIGYAAAAKWAQQYNNPAIGRYSIAGPPGAVGAAAAAAAYLGLPTERAIQAVRIAEERGTSAPSLGILRIGATETKELLSYSAAVGVNAALAAAKGFEGPQSLLDDANFESHACDEDSIESSVYLKPYPACRFLHPSLDAIRALGVLPGSDSISCLSITTPKAPSVFDKRDPCGPYQRQFSIPYSVMCLVRDGKLSPESFFDRPLSPDDENFIERIKLAADSALQEYGCFHAASVRISLADGCSVEGFCREPAGANTTREYVLGEKWRYASQFLRFSGSVWDLEQCAVTRKAFLSIIS